MSEITYRNLSMNRSKILKESLKNTRHQSPTQGVLSNHFICQKCGHDYPIQLDTFHSISLSLPSTIDPTPISLYSCLEKFFEFEDIEDYLCQYCNEKSILRKKIQLIKLPKLLCFHIQRLVWTADNEFVKRTDHIKFTEFLFMDRYKRRKELLRSANDDSVLNRDATFNNLVENQIVDFSSCDKILFDQKKFDKTRLKNIYSLNSVIVHLGDSKSGHFICLRRKMNPNSKKIRWLYVSDLTVKEVSRDEVLAANAYMLFYELN